MINVSHKTCKENQNKHFVFSISFFSKIVPFKRKRGRLQQRRKGHKWQYGACAFHAGQLKLNTHTHTHRICNIYCFFPLHHWLHERASIGYVKRTLPALQIT